MATLQQGDHEMKILILAACGIALVALGWYIGIRSVYTVTYNYPPKGQPFLETSKGNFVQAAARNVVEKHIGVPFRAKDRSYFMLFDAFDLREEGGIYHLPSGDFRINNTIK